MKCRSSSSGRECRDFATHWLNVQREEFKRLGVVGDWENPYLTMSYPAEAQIAREIMQFAMTDQLYRGSKPVMWSVVEKTSLAEAEIEYQDYQSDMIWAAFPVRAPGDATLGDAAGGHLDDHALDDPWEPRDLLQQQDLLRPLCGDGERARFRAEDRRALYPR